MIDWHAFASSSRAPLLLAAVIGLSVAGFLIGVDEAQFTAFDRDLGSSKRSPSADEIPQARTYAQAAATPWHIDQTWHSMKNVLQSGPAYAQQLPLTRQELFTQRAKTRAYDGAPPTVPHAIIQRGAPDCLACHRHGAVLPAGQVAPIMSHREYTLCTQCHAASLGTPVRDEALAQPLATSQFTGLAAPQPGERAWPGAPPTIPHSLAQREQCLACHGVFAQPNLRTSHPERTSCLQCHAQVVEAMPGHPLLPPIR